MESSEIKRVKKPKESFLATFFRKLFCCVGVDSRAHDIDVDGVASVGSGPTLLAHKTADNAVKQFSEKAPVASSGQPAVPLKDLLESAGATSRAVQLPGSSVPGQVLKTSASRPSEHGNESDDVSFDELSEEDEMLIKNGGAGIPMGSVSGSVVQWIYF